jgi:TP901 family phage tail tape measure protein
MAGKYRIGFAIEGDTKSAIAALMRLAKSMDDLTKAMDRFVAASQKGSKRTKKQNKETADSVTAIVRSYDRATNAARKFHNIQLAGGGPRLPPPPPPPVQAALTGSSGGQRALPSPSNISAQPSRIAQVTASIKAMTAAMIKFGAKAAAAFQTAKGHALSFSMTALTAARRISTSFSGGVVSALDRTGRMFKQTRLAMMAVVDSFRLTTQAVTNLGRAMFFFVTIPLVAFFGGITRAAIDFEDAMIRVQKVTDLPDWDAAGKDIQTLTNNLRQLARNTPTAHVQLAEMATIIGQMGVKNPNAIANLTMIFDMFKVATDLSADEVARNLGSIANAFQWNLNAASEDVFRLANVINHLENNTNANADQIMKAMRKWAQAANQLKITAAEAAGLSSVLISMGLSEEEAGTALRNMSLYLIKNSDELARLMKHYDKYNSQAKVLAAINENAVQVFIDFAKAASESEDAASAFLAMMDVGNLRGGRAIAALSTNLERVQEILKMSRDEWENATSLMTEYERALTSTKSQLAMFRNNINDVGITMGETLLPIINELVQVLVPALRMLSDRFKALPKNTQLTVMAVIGLVMVLGPLVMFLGQILHAVALVAMGFGQLLKIVPMITGALQSLVVLLPGVARFFLGWPGLIIGAATLILKVLSRMGVDISGFFIGLIARFHAWGEKMMATMSDGILAGALRYVIKVVTAVANIIAAFFKGQSPPKVGPLSTIDRWGAKVMQAYLMGFRNADFSVLNEVGRIIERILTRGVDDKGMPGALQKYAKARVIISKLLSKYRATGILDPALLNEAVEGVSMLRDEIKELVRLSIEYNRIQEKIADLENRRKSSVKSYDDEIAAIARSNMSAEDKVTAIRAAQRARDDSLRGLEAEEQMLKDQADVMSAQLEFQRSLIDTLNEQEDILARIAEALDRLAKSGGGGGGDGGFAFPAPEDDEEALKKLEEASEELFNFMDRFEKGTQKFQGLLDGMSGEARKVFEDPDVQTTYDALYDLGAQVKDIKESFEQLGASWSGFKALFTETIPGMAELGGVFEKINKGIDDFIERVEGSFKGAIRILTGNNPAKGIVASLQDGDMLKSFLLGFGIFVGPEIEAIQERLAGIKDAFDRIMESLSPLFNLLKETGMSIPWDQIGAFFSTVAGAVAGISSAVVMALLDLILGIVEGGADLLAFFVEMGMIHFDNVLNFFNALNEGKGIVEALIEAWENIDWQRINDLGSLLGDMLIKAVKGILGIKSPSTVFAAIGEEVIEGLKQGVIDTFGSAVTLIDEKMTEWKDKVRSFIEPIETAAKDIITLGFIAGINKIWTDVITTITTKMGELETTLKGYETSMRTIGSSIARGFSNGVYSLLSSVAGSAPEPFKSWLNNLISAFRIKSPSKVMAGIGRNVGLGFIQGLDEVMASQMGLSLALAGGLSANINGEGPVILGLEVHLHDPVVREERDLKRLAEMVMRLVSEKSYNAGRYGGALTY